MFKNIHWSRYLLFGGVAALFYCIPAGIFINRANFSYASLLYLGNFLFLLIIAALLLWMNQKRKENSNAMSMLLAGHLTTLIGIIISCLLCALMLAVFIPGIIEPGTPEKLLSGAPVNTVRDKTNGLSFMVFSNAIVGNFSAGFFVSIILPFTIKKDQTKEKAGGLKSEI